MMSQSASNKGRQNSKHITYAVSGAFICSILGYYCYSQFKQSSKSNKNQKKILNKSNDEQSKPKSNYSNKIQTKLWKINSNKNLSFNDYLKNPSIAAAGNALRNGETIAFPTETVYGLGANAFSNKACNKIFIAKGRPNDNPLIVHISEINQLYKWILNPVNKNNQKPVIHPIIHKLMESFWPGPLSIVFPYICDNNKSDMDSTNIICSTVRGAGKLQSVAVRMPSNNIARAVISLAQCPIAGPSANISGRPSPTNSKHVLNDMDGKIYGILDCGETNCCDIGLESTVIKMDEINNRIIILRPGGITKKMMYDVVKDYNYAVDIKYAKEIKETQGIRHDNNIVEAPGMKYRHYAPKKPLFLVDNVDLFADMYWFYKLKNEIDNVVFIITKQNVLAQKCKQNKNILLIGDGDDLNEIASNLFIVLRKIDDDEEYKNTKLIFCQVFNQYDIGVAIMNRLNKAAQSNKVIKNLNDLQAIGL